MNIPYILWLGSVFDESTVGANTAVSPAANHWELGLIEALQARSTSVSMLGHLPEPLWPKGRVNIGAGQGQLAPGIQGELVQYWNLPGFRSANLRQNYITAFERRCHRQGLPLAVISYNDSAPNVATGVYAQMQMGIPWVSIIADLSDPGLNWERFSKVTAQAAGHVFLSWGAYASAPFRPKLHLDGGMYRLKSNSVNHITEIENKRIIVYAGAMNQYGGVSFLVEGFHQIKQDNVELWICGKGNNPDVERMAGIDSRIKFWGLVSREHLNEICHRATIFVNPRPSQIPDNRMNFPSKVLEYLSYGKPVISTWTDGLSPTYRDVLIVLEEETPECLARTLEDVLDWDTSHRLDYQTRIRAFCESEKTWAVQADRLLEWLNTEILRHDRLSGMNHQ